MTVQTVTMMLLPSAPAMLPLAEAVPKACRVNECGQRAETVERDVVEQPHGNGTHELPEGVTESNVMTLITTWNSHRPWSSGDAAYKRPGQRWW